MCLLKGIEVNCSNSKIVNKIESPLYKKCANKFAKELLCTNHQLLYKNWCEAGGYFKLLINNIDATEIENVEYFKNELLSLKTL